MSADILVVDDNPQNRLLAEAQLESVGYRVTLADSGAAALALLETRTFDLVLLDVMMPALDGFETCRRIRELPAARRVPILFLTASHDAAIHERALDSGGDDFLKKPIERTELLLRVRSLIRITRLQAERDAFVAKLEGPLAALLAHGADAVRSAGSDEAKEAITEVTTAAKSLHDMIVGLREK